MDDHAIGREMLADYLRIKGFEVCTAADVETGMCLLNDASPTPDVIVTDLVMPGPDGKEFLHRIRTGGYPDLPVVCLTAASEEGINGLGNEPFVTVLRKPTEPSDIVATLERVSGKA